MNGFQNQKHKKGKLFHEPLLIDVPKSVDWTKKGYSFIFMYYSLVNITLVVASFYKQTALSERHDVLLSKHAQSPSITNFNYFHIPCI